VKSLLLTLADLLGTIWRLLPERLRTGLITGLLVLDSRHPDPAQGLRRLFAARDRLELVTAERAMALGKGEHPKHRLTAITTFSSTASPTANGCSTSVAAMARWRATSRRPPRLRRGRHRHEPAPPRPGARRRQPAQPLLREGDATRAVPDGGWDTVVLSNVLEHIVDRVGFLSALIAATGATKFLIRVPHFEREWQMALRKELGGKLLR
jgi:hypothetical protein